MSKVIAPMKMSQFMTAYKQLIVEELSKNGINDLDPSYGNIIYELSDRKKLTMKELAKNINRDKSTVTVLIRNLEKKGYVQKVDNEDDLRSKFIVLTEDAKNMSETLNKISGEVNNTIWKDIHEDDSEIFMKVLNKLIENTKNGRAK